MLTHPIFGSANPNAVIAPTERLDSVAFDERDDVDRTHPMVNEFSIRAASIQSGWSEGERNGRLILGELRRELLLTMVGNSCAA